MKTRHEVLKSLPNAAASVGAVYNSLKISSYPNDVSSKLRNAEEYGVLWLSDVMTLVNVLFDEFERDGPPLPMNLEDEINGLRPIVNIDGDEYVSSFDVKALLRDLAPSLFEED